MELHWKVASCRGGGEIYHTIPEAACAPHFDANGKPDGWRVRIAELEEEHPLKVAADGADYVLLPRDECEMVPKFIAPASKE